MHAYVKTAAYSRRAREKVRERREEGKKEGQGENGTVGLKSVDSKPRGKEDRSKIERQ